MRHCARSLCSPQLYLPAFTPHSFSDAVQHDQVRDLPQGSAPRAVSIPERALFPPGSNLYGCSPTSTFATGALVSTTWLCGWTRKQAAAIAVKWFVSASSTVQCGLPGHGVALGLSCRGGGWRVEGGGWRVEGGGWRVWEWEWEAVVMCGWVRCNVAGAERVLGGCGGGEAS